MTKCEIICPECEKTIEVIVCNQCFKNADEDITIEDDGFLYHFCDEQCKSAFMQSAQPARRIEGRIDMVKCKRCGKHLRVVYNYGWMPFCYLCVREVVLKHTQESTGYPEKMTVIEFEKATGLK